MRRIDYATEQYQDYARGRALTEQQLAELVTRDSMIGTGFPKTPGAPS